MILVFHGENSVVSRESFVSKRKQLKKSSQEQLIDAQSALLVDVQQVLASNSLFGNESFAVIEHLFSGRKSKTKNEIIDYLGEYSGDIPILVWEPKTLTSSQQKQLPTADFLESKVSKKIFKLLDSLRPNYPAAHVTLLAQVLETEPIELVFALIVGRFRQLVQLQHGGVVKSPGWLKQKLTNQARAFDQRKLVSDYQRLVQIDNDVKTGVSLMPLDKQLDLWLLNL